jgi:hypothetical protein
MFLTQEAAVIVSIVAPLLALVVILLYPPPSPGPHEASDGKKVGRTSPGTGIAQKNKVGREAD